MEQKKLLWVIFSAVGFVLVVAVVGLVLFWDNEKDKTEDGSKIVSGVVRDFDPVEWVQKNGEYPGIEDPAGSGDDVILVYGDSEEESVGNDIGEAQTEPGEESETAGKAGTAEGAGADSGKGSDDIEITVYQPDEVKKSIPAPKQEPESVPKPQPVQKNIKEYWIQAGSYTSMIRADEVKKKLSEKGIASVITTKSVDDTDYYRVRIGPYGSKAEAEKFLSWIQGVRGFESSYVSMVYVNRSLN